MYGGLDIRMSHFPSDGSEEAKAVLEVGVVLVRAEVREGISVVSTFPRLSKMLACMKVTSSLALASNFPDWILCSRFLFDKANAEGLMSTPMIFSLGIDGASKEWSNSGIHPVPVQRSKMRNSLSCDWEDIFDRIH